MVVLGGDAVSYERETPVTSSAARRRSTVHSGTLPPSAALHASRRCTPLITRPFFIARLSSHAHHEQRCAPALDGTPPAPRAARFREGGGRGGGKGGGGGGGGGRGCRRRAGGVVLGGGCRGVPGWRLSPSH